MKRIIAMLLLIVSIMPLSAIGFGYHVFDIRTEPEFGEGIFPTSVMYQFNFPMPDFIEGRRTVLAFRLDNGLEYRKLRQDPDTGAILAKDPPPYPTEYTVLFDEFNLFFAQGFGETRDEEKDLITAFISLDGRFENAYERLSWLTSPDSMEGVFSTYESGIRTERFPSSSWVGAPELAGSRSIFQTSLTAGVRFDWMDDDVTRRDGIRAASYLRFSPAWMPVSYGGGADFFLMWNELELSRTLLTIGQERRPELSWLSIVLDDKLTYRFIIGDKVPAYVQGGDIWGESDVPNGSHVIMNRLSMTFYGPQINSRDSFPSLMVFWDFGVALGHVLNRGAVREAIAETVGSYGIRAEFVVFGICKVYYEIGCSYDGVFNEPGGIEQRFGVTVGI